MSNKKEDLGRGIRALLENIETGNEKPADKERPILGSASSYVSLDLIEINPFQPRADFDEQSLKELADSITIHGIIQPITLRRIAGNKYQLIAGERRLRAAKLAGLDEIPAFIRSANDQEMLEIALIENIHREDLNPVEIAINYQRLIDECQLKHQELAIRLGKNRATVSNYLRLLKLPPEIQKGLKAGDIDMGHAKALISLEDPVMQLSIYKEAVSKQLSVRQVESTARQYKKQGSLKKKAAKSSLSPEWRNLQDDLASYLSTRVNLKAGKEGRGELSISFLSEDDLYRIIDLIR